MRIFDGVIALDDHPVPVIIGLEDETIRLSSNGEVIGTWSWDECIIEANTGGGYTITVENESLVFLPNQPEQFSRQVNGAAVTQATEQTARPARSAQHVAKKAPASSFGSTGLKAMFYLLCAVTAGLGIWAFSAVFF